MASVCGPPAERLVGQAEWWYAQAKHLLAHAMPHHPHAIAAAAAAAVWCAAAPVHACKLRDVHTLGWTPGLARRAHSQHCWLIKGGRFTNAQRSDLATCLQVMSHPSLAGIP